MKFCSNLKRPLAEILPRIEPAIPKVVECLSDEDPNVRCAALKSIGTHSEQSGLFFMI